MGRRLNWAEGLDTMKFEGQNYPSSRNGTNGCYGLSVTSPLVIRNKSRWYIRPSDGRSCALRWTSETRTRIESIRGGGGGGGEKNLPLKPFYLLPLLLWIPSRSPISVLSSIKESIGLICFVVSSDRFAQMPRTGSGFLLILSLSFLLCSGPAALRELGDRSGDVADAAVELNASNFRSYLKESPLKFAVVEFFASWYRISSSLCFFPSIVLRLLCPKVIFFMLCSCCKITTAGKYVAWVLASATVVVIVDVECESWMENLFNWKYGFLLEPSLLVLYSRWQDNKIFGLLSAVAVFSLVIVKIILAA